MDFQFGVNIVSSTLSEDKDLIIEGTAVDSSVNENRWAVPLDELDSLTTQFNSKRQVRVDHSKAFKDIVGYVEKAERDGDKIKFKARIYDPTVQRIILKNPTAHYVSIGALAEDVKCSKCSKPSKPFKTCKCEGAHDVVRKIKLKELSFITDPAYENTEFQPVGFSASLTSAIDSFAPKKEYKCDNLNPDEEKICKLIKEYNPGTLWNLSAAKELYPIETNDFIREIQRRDVAQATDSKIKSENKMVEKIETENKSENTEKNIGELKAAVTDALKEHFKAAEEEVKKKDIPIGKTVPSQKGHQQKMEDEDEAKKEDEDEVKKKENTTRIEKPGDDAVMVLSKKVEEMTKKLEDIAKAEEMYHKEEDAISVLSQKMEEVVKKMEAIYTKFPHKKKEDEAKKEDEKVDEAKKEASSKKAYNIGAKTAPETNVESVDTATSNDAAWAEIVGVVKNKKPEWDI